MHNFFLSPHAFMDEHPDLTRAAAVYAVVIEPALQHQAEQRIEQQQPVSSTELVQAAARLQAMTARMNTYMDEHGSINLMGAPKC